MTGTNKNFKIKVNYTNQTKPVNLDIIFNLPNAGKDEANVNTEYLYDNFGGTDANGEVIAMIPSPATNTIVMKNASVGLIVGDEAKVLPFVTVSEAVAEIKKKDNLQAGNNYTITFFVEGYSFIRKDFTEMDSLTNSTVGQVTWTSKIGENKQDLPAAHTVYIAGDGTFFGTKTILKDLKLSATGVTRLYADGKPIEVQGGVECTGTLDLYGGSRLTDTTAATVTLQSGTFRNIYGGGTTALKGDAVITVSGGTVETIYGGGNGTAGALTGNTQISVTGGEVTKAIYGGGSNAAVNGTTKITYTVQNATKAKTDTLETISGAGTDAAGALADNVTGTGTGPVKTIVLNMVGSTHTGGLDLENLTGFDRLEIGTKQGTSSEKALVRVKSRFDSSAVDRGNNNRADTVELYHASLILSGSTSGHIGRLKTTGECLLVIPRNTADQATLPLKVDSAGNEINENAKLKLAVLPIGEIDHTNKEQNLSGDKVITFMNKNGVPAEEHKKYRDALVSKLTVIQQEDGEQTHIQFSTPSTHIAAGWIEYPGNAPDGIGQPVNSKKIHLIYDKKNKHEVRTDKQSGYIVAMPKTKTDSADSTKYTVTDETFITSGTLSTAMNGEKTYAVNFTKAPNIEQGAGCHEATADVTITGMDTKNYWYILHTLCDHDEASVLLLDVDAPMKTESGVIVTFDTKTDNYIYELQLKDTTWDAQKLPSTKPGDRMQYDPNGISAAYWAVGDLNGTNLTNADTEAVKKDNIQTSGADGGLRGQAQVSLLAGGSPTVQGGLTAKVVVTVPKTLVEANSNGAIWVYAKDGVNNTVRVAVPLNDKIIDVSVPVEVNVIAVKKTQGKNTELLTPECKVINNSAKRVEVSMSGFATTQEQTKLKLVKKEKTAVFDAAELALFVKGAQSTTFAETNVLNLDKTPVSLGILGKSGAADSTAAYTFDAGYNPGTINLPDGFIENILSYHFKIVD